MIPQHYNIYDDPLFKQLVNERNLQKRSQKYYRTGLNAYTKYNDMTLQELYNEADKEEEEGVRAKNRTIVKRLRGFRTHLIQEGYEPVTIKHYYASARTFYTHFLIEIPYIPSVKLPTKQVLSTEIPKKEHIIEAIQHTNNLKHIAIIYFMASSGTASNELCSITIQDFIDATSEYHNSSNIYDVVSELENQDQVIPLFQLTRLKTNYRYWTLCTPEATTHILRYLKTRPLKKLRPQEQLFPLTPNAVGIFYRRINEKCKYPKTFFHPHAMRKYQADILQDWDLTNRLQGRKPPSIRETYDKVNPQKLKQRYIKHLGDLTLNPTKVVTLESKEVMELKDELERERKETNKELQADMDELKSEVKVFGKMLNEILTKQN